MTASREHWSGRAGFILANVAAAVGLGSIWKFPYEVGTNGGGSFVICYVVGLILIVLPLMLCELAIGRRGRSDAIESVAVVAAAAQASRWWPLFASPRRRHGRTDPQLLLSHWRLGDGLSRRHRPSWTGPSGRRRCQGPL